MEHIKIQDDAVGERPLAQAEHGAGRMASVTSYSKALKLIYISPKLPSLSATFEQNELMGLRACGVEVKILSCRKVPVFERLDCHEFCRPLLSLVQYPSLSTCAKGVAWCLRNRPWITAKLATRAVLAALMHPVRACQHLGAFLLAVGFAPFAVRVSADGVHADFVQGSGTVAWYLSELLHLRLTMTAHAFDIFSCKPGATDRISFFRRKLAAASAVFVAHNFGRQWLATIAPEVTGRLKVHRVTVRVSGIQPLQFPRHGTVPLIIALGRLERKKGFDQLIRAVASLRNTFDVRCEIYGSGREWDNLVGLVKDLHLTDRVQFRGAYRQEDLPVIFRDAVCLVVPSVMDPDGDMDGIPTVIYEAMAYGRPVIASAISGIPEIIRHSRTGLLVQPAKPEKLAEAIQNLLSDIDRARRMGLAARTFVSQQHDYLEQARQFAQLLTEAYQSND